MLLIYLTMRVTDVLMFFFLFFILFRQEQSRSQTSPCRRLLTTSRSSSPSPVRSNTWKCEGRYALSIMPNYSWINMLYWFLFKLLIWRESETSQVAYVTFKEFHGADTALLLSVSYLNASILASSIYSSWPSILPEILWNVFKCAILKCFDDLCFIIIIIIQGASISEASVNITPVEDYVLPPEAYFYRQVRLWESSCSSIAIN